MSSSCSVRSFWEELKRRRQLGEDCTSLNPALLSDVEKLLLPPASRPGGPGSKKQVIAHHAC